MWRPRPCLHQGRDNQVHGAQVGLHQGVSGLPQVCQRAGRDDGEREEAVPAVHHWMFLSASGRSGQPPPQVLRPDNYLVILYNVHSQVDHCEEDRGWWRKLPVSQHVCPLSEGKTAVNFAIRETDSPLFQLPDYSSEEVLKERLLAATNEKGFHLNWGLHVVGVVCRVTFEVMWYLSINFKVDHNNQDNRLFILVLFPLSTTRHQ